MEAVAVFKKSPVKQGNASPALVEHGYINNDGNPASRAAADGGLTIPVIDNRFFSQTFAQRFLNFV